MLSGAAMELRIEMNQRSIRAKRGFLFSVAIVILLAIGGFFASLRTQMDPPVFMAEVANDSVVHWLDNGDFITVKTWFNSKRRPEIRVVDAKSKVSKRLANVEDSYLSKRMKHPWNELVCKPSPDGKKFGFVDVVVISGAPNRYERTKSSVLDIKTNQETNFPDTGVLKKEPSSIRNYISNFYWLRDSSGIVVRWGSRPKYSFNQYGDHRTNISTFEMNLFLCARPDRRREIPLAKLPPKSDLIGVSEASQLIFESGTSKGFQITLTDLTTLETGSRNEFSPSPNMSLTHSPSPDGKSLLTFRARRIEPLIKGLPIRIKGLSLPSQFEELWLANITTGKLKRIGELDVTTFPTDFQQYRWLPDSKRVSFISNGKLSTIRVVK